MKTQAALALPHASDAPIDDLNRRRRISGTVNLAIRVQECMTDTRCELPFKALLIQWHLDLEALTRQTRSEEHTSELQSLMRISYAVFCLKKKKTITITKHQPRISI